MSRSRSNAVPPHLSHAKPAGTNALERPLVPRVGALCLEDRRGVLDERRRQQRLAARPGSASAGIGTPQARWREMHQSGRVTNMPVMRSRPHAGIQRDAVGFRDRRLAQPVHADEPLRRRQEDHRLMAAPAVRIRVLELRAVPQAPAFRRARSRRPDSPRRPSGRRRRRRRAGTGRRGRSARRCRGRTARRCGSRPRRGRAPCARRPCPARA